MRLTLLILVLLAAPLLLFSQPKSGQEPDSLHDATALRPADLILNEPIWNISSIDMYTFHINNGLYGIYGPQPDILLDGIPVDVNFFGWQNLNMIPVYMPIIHKVKSKTNPGLYKEEFYPAGMVDFINNMPSKGLNLSGTIYLGNESGDPGPWIYDSSRVTPNVDRWGPDAGGVFSISENNWYERIIFTQRKHQQTDPITHRRILRTMRELGGTGGKFYPNQTISQSGLFETGYKSKLLDFKTRLIIAEDQNYLYLQPFAREVPSKAHYQQIVLDAGYKNEKWKLGLSYILNQKKLKRRNSDHDYIFNWNQDNNLFKGSVAVAFNNYSLKGSINFNQQITKAPGILKNNDLITDVSVTADWQKNNHATFKLVAGLDMHRNQIASTIKASYDHKVGKRWKINASGIYNEMLPIHQQSFGYWISRGYNFSDELGIVVEEPLIISKNRLISFKLENFFRPAEQLSFSLISELTRHYELNIPWQDARYDINTGTTPGPFVISQERGTLFKARASSIHQLLDWFKQELSLEYQATLQGTNRFEEYYQQIPVAQVKYRLHIMAVKNLNLSLQGYYRTSTTWKEFDALDGKEYRDIDNLFPVFTGTYQSTAPAHFDLEVGAKKWFSNQTFSLQLTVRNLLNDEVRLHPFGAAQSLMFNIKAVADF